MAESLKHKTVKGVIWSAIERFSVQGIQFLVMVAIARVLSPREYGLIGMLAVFTAVSQSLINSGFSQALIRKRDRTEADNSTVFYFNIVASVILYVLLYVIAPYVADFYNEPQLVDVMRVVCLTIIINAFLVVQRAIYTINLDFKTQAKASMIAVVLSGAVGIYFAYTGYGVWALVFQQLVNSIVSGLFLWYYSNWFPKWLYSWKSFKELFAFGSKMMLSGLLDTLYANIYQLVIGKVFAASSLGNYSRAHHFAEFPSQNINNVIQRVTYPILCTIQDDDNRLRDTYMKFLKLSAFIVFPLMCGLAGVAYPFVRIVIGEQWEYAATLLIPICFWMMWYPIHSINLNLLQVKGRSDLFLKLEIIKKVVGVAFLVALIPYGLLVMCYGGIVSNFIGLYINTYYSKKLIGLGFIQQMKILMPVLLLSLTMFFLLLYLNSLISSNYIQLGVSIPIGILFFVGTAYLLKFKELSELVSLVRRKL